MRAPASPCSPSASWRCTPPGRGPGRLVRGPAGAAPRLAVLPECFVSLYPSGSWAGATNPWNAAFDELWERLWTSSVDVPGPMLDRLATVCRERDLHVAIGVNERD